jgi:DNA-binding winged helix-turn-helix (wHTH) protein/tetratricopeptide (TPR) repeat protein
VTETKVLRFGECELDIASREFRRGGELVSIEPRVFALLLFLIEHRSRAVDKDEIQDEVWKGAIVSETALTRAIMKARRAVGDSSEQQAVIRTVHGHGYQFVADLNAEREETPVADTPPERRLATPRVFAGIIALVIVAFIVMLWPAAAPTSGVRIAVMPVANESGDKDYDWTRLGLMGFANDIISESPALQVVAASDVMRHSELRDSRSDAPDMEADFTELQRLYGASHMLLSSLEQNANVLRLSYSLYKPDGDIERGTMVGAEPTELMRGMVRSVTASLGERPRGVDEVTVVSDDPFINEAYSRGLSYALEGRCAEALDLFEVVTSRADTVSRADYEWANCARILGRWEDAEARFKKMLEALPAEPSSSMRAMTMHGLGTVYIRTGRHELAREILNLGLAEAKAAGDLVTQGKLLNNLSIEARNRREFSEAREMLARARLAYTEAGIAIVPGQIPSALANIDMAEGKLDDADEHLQQALTTFRTLGDRRNEAMMLNNLGYLRTLQGRDDEAEPVIRQSLQIRKEIGDTVGQGRVLGMLATLYVDAGRLQEARDAALEANRIATEANDPLYMATSLAQLAAVEWRAEDYDASRTTYTEAQRLFEQIEDHSRVAQVAMRLAQLDMITGDLESATSNAQGVLDLSLREGLHEPAIEAMETLGDIAQRQADSDVAIDAYENTLSHMQEWGFVAKQSRVMRKLADVHIEQDDLAAAEPLIGRLIELGESAETEELLQRYREAQAK